MYKITGIVMKVAPIGILGLLAPVVGQYGLSVLLPLLKVIIAVYLACILHAVIVYSSAVKTWGKMSPLKFFKGISPAALVAFSTASSSGTLPVTIKNTNENLGVPNKIASFVFRLVQRLIWMGQPFIKVLPLFSLHNFMVWNYHFFSF